MSDENETKTGPIELRGEAGPELLFPQRPPQVHHDANCVELLLGGRCNCSAAPTGPLTPGQVMCTVCRLDDRTRAATDPNDLRCHECRAAQAAERKTPAEMAKYAVDPETGGPLRAESPGERHLDAVAEAERVSTVDWSVLAPELAAAAQARQHVWVSGTGSLRNCFCHHGVDHTEEPLTDLQIAAQAIRDNPPRLPEPPIVSRRWRDETRANVEAMKQVSDVTVTVHGEGPLLVWVGALLASFGVESTVTMPAPLVENEFGTFCKFCSARVGMLHTSVCHADGVVGQPTVLPYAGDPNAPMFQVGDDEEEVHRG